ncbi:MAG: hypothetical protein KAJ19_27425 [Gammaproteobacteria bacterium]|nr:hypothetical protein [Gammaproteobacteria bacterium]
MLKSGLKSTEFYGIVILALMVGFGIIAPEAVTTPLNEGATFWDTAVGSIKDIAQSKGELAIYAAILWAYIKRRSSLKDKELSEVAQAAWNAEQDAKRDQDARGSAVRKESVKP